MKGARERDRQSCLCRKHVECKILFDSCMKFRKATPMDGNGTVPLDSLVANLPLNDVICVHDFSENYICRSQDEIQSQYFDPNKVSIHVSILYHHADPQLDGKESTEVNPCIIKEHIFALSDDTTQDYHFVHHVQSLIVHYLRNQLHLTVNKIHEFTDGCAGQYKSKHTFGDLSCCLADFECQIDRHFF